MKFFRLFKQRFCTDFTYANKNTCRNYCSCGQWRMSAHRGRKQSWRSGLRGLQTKCGCRDDGTIENPVVSEP
jgi:hypothetical protein